MQSVIDIGYMVIGVFIMLSMVGMGVVGIVKVIRDINKIKDIE